MQQIHEKRTYDARVFDIDCSLLLAATETIANVVGITEDTGELTFDTPLVNTSPITYPGPRTVAVGKVVQVRIGGGTIPQGARSSLRTIRAQLVTSAGAQQVEATVQLRLIDTPG